MLGDDLVGQLAQGPGPGLGFRQGTVVSWNAETGANQVDVGGAVLVDVPVLNTGEAIALKAGHIVGLLTWQGSYWIIGRITIPGNPDFASASVAFGGEGASTTGFSVTTTATDVVTDTMAVPSWVDEAIVLCVVNATISNANSTITSSTLQAGIDGVYGGASGGTHDGITGNPADDERSMSASAQRKVINPGATISLAGRISATGAMGAPAANIINLDAIAVFRSTT